MFLDSMADNRSLVTIDKMDLVRAFAELMPNGQQQSLDEKLDKKIDFAISTYRHKLYLPKISLTAITAFVTFIFLFPGQIKDNPALSKVIDPSSLQFVMGWFMLLVYSGMFWLMSFLSEEKSKKKLAM